MGNSLYHFTSLDNCLQIISDNMMECSTYNAMQIDKTNTFNKNLRNYYFVSTTRNKSFKAGYNLYNIDRIALCRIELDEDLLRRKFKIQPIWIDYLYKDDEYEQPNWVADVRNRDFKPEIDAQMEDMREERVFVRKPYIENIIHYIKSITLSIVRNSNREVINDIRLKSVILDTYCKQLHIPLKFINKGSGREVSQDVFQNQNSPTMNITCKSREKMNYCRVSFGVSIHITDRVKSLDKEIQKNNYTALSSIKCGELNYDKIIENPDMAFDFIVNHMDDYINFLYNKCNQVLDKKIITDNVRFRIIMKNKAIYYRIQDGELVRDDGFDFLNF